jgi:hypothetical protein
MGGMRCLFESKGETLGCFSASAGERFAKIKFGQEEGTWPLFIKSGPGSFGTIFVHWTPG